MNYKMIIQYDGSRYNGWQRLGSTDNTIQGKLEQVISGVTGEQVLVHGAGRTDAGVHAKGQTANIILAKEMPPEQLRREMNRYLPEDIKVANVSEASPRFHSRLNAAGKIYCYRVATDLSLHVFERKYMYPFEAHLNVKKMRTAAEYLLGEHDFQSFCARKMKKSTIRRIDSISIEELPGEIRFTIEGNGFLHHMIRIIVGTLLEIGSGQRREDELKEILAERKRERAGFTAPARGLTLMEVKY